MSTFDQAARLASKIVRDWLRRAATCSTLYGFRSQMSGQNGSTGGA
jgi:hypothetical protein